MLLFIFQSANAQLVDPAKLLKRNATDRTNQKIDQTMDKALDKVFNGFGKKNQAQNEPERETSDDSPNTEAPDLGKLLGNMSFGNTPPPASSYSFTSSYIMQVKTTGNKKGENMTMKMKYMVDQEGKMMGTKMLETDNPDMNKSLGMMEASIFDMERMIMYNFMNVNGQKQYMGIAVKEGAVGDALEGEYQKTSISKLSQNKTIAGYACEAFLLDDGKTKSTVWLSIKPVPSVARYYDKFNKMTATQKGQLKLAYQANPELIKLFKEGRALMGMDMKENNTSTSLEVLNISPSDNFSISTSGYSSMMSIEDMMKQGKN